MKSKCDIKLKFSLSEARKGTIERSEDVIYKMYIDSAKHSTVQQNPAKGNTRGNNVSDVLT